MPGQTSRRSTAVEQGLPADWRARVVGRSLGPATDKAMRQGQELIAAAGRLMRRLDADELTIQNIAAEAGVSVRVLYRHFEGKDDLLVALIEESQLVFANLLQDRASGPDDALERLGQALVFATDPRQHSDPNYNRALARFTARTWLTEPDRVGSAHRPVLQVLSRLILDAMESGQVERGDPEVAAANVYGSYRAYQMNLYLGNSLGGKLPSPRHFVRYCLLGLGASLPEGWEDRLGRSAGRLSRADIKKATKPVKL